MRTVFVTGASGLIGGNLIPRLLNRECKVTALVHSNSDVTDNAGTPIPGVETIVGDVSKPNLGLTTETLRKLREQTDLVVHSAAVTTFGYPDDLYARVNYEGTKNATAFAFEAKRPLPFIYVSTAFVCGYRQGEVRENELDTKQSFRNAYERSKFQAELHLRDCISRGCPIAVARPGMVVGDSRTGAVRDFSNLYVIIRLVTRGLSTALPANPDSVLNLAPIDYVADALEEIVLNFEQARGQTFHLAAQEVSLRELSEIVAEYPYMKVPKFISPATFEPRSLSTREQRLFKKVVSLYAPYLGSKIRFLSERFNDLAPGILKRLPENKILLRRLLDECERVGYLGPVYK